MMQVLHLDCLILPSSDETVVFSEKLNARGFMIGSSTHE